MNTGGRQPESEKGFSGVETTAPLSALGMRFSDASLERAFQRANMAVTRQYIFMLGCVAIVGALVSGYGAWLNLPADSRAFQAGMAIRAALLVAALFVIVACRFVSRPWFLYACNAVVLAIGYTAIALRSSVPGGGELLDPSVLHVTQNGLMLLFVVSMTQLILVPGWFLVNALVSVLALAGFMVVMERVGDTSYSAFDASLVGIIGYLLILGMGISAQRLRRSSFHARLRLQQANLQLNELATRDHLTGCANRRHFYALAESELTRSLRYQRALSLVILDIDHFKEVNDQFGHAAGDRLLRTLGGVIGRELRDLDTFGRIGGEEFALLLPETSVGEAGQIAERLRGVIENLRVSFEGQDIGVTASFGVTERQAEDRGIDALMRRADFALYEAKAAGRNRVRSRERGHRQSALGH